MDNKNRLSQENETAGIEDDIALPYIVHGLRQARLHNLQLTAAEAPVEVPRPSTRTLVGRFAIAGGLSLSGGLLLGKYWAAARG